MTHALVLLRRDDNGHLMLEDATGKVYVVRDGDEAISTLKRILQDPDLPQVDHTPGNTASFEQAFSKAFEGSIPEPLRPLASMGLSALATKVQRMSTARIRGRKTVKR